MMRKDEDTDDSSGERPYEVRVTVGCKMGSLLLRPPFGAYG